jgi:hypothetical protein
MAESVGMVVWASLVACCIVIVAYELVRHVQPEITLDKLIAAGIYVLWFIVACVFAGKEGPFFGLHLLVPLGLIWFGDELGSVTGLKCGLVQCPSPGFLVRLSGWFLLIAFLGFVIYHWITCGTH